MNRAHGQIRRGQIIGTYGPGALIDLPNDSAIVGGLETWSKVGPEEEILEPRLSQKLQSLTGIPLPRLYAPPPESNDLREKARGIGAFRFPEWFVVGIGYPGGAAEMDQKRCRDLSPLPKPDPDSGEADRFMMFVTDEAIPLIESTFRVIPTDRTLVGCSMGGLFTLYALFQHPSVFQRYLLSSPRIEPIVFDWEDRHSQTCNQLPAHLYMSAGTEGKIEPILHERVMKLSERLTGRSYKGLKLWTEEFTGEDHVSVQPMALARGLNLIFTETSR